MTYYEEPTPELEELHRELGYYPKPDDYESTSDFPEGHALRGKNERCRAWNTAKGRQCMGIAQTTKGLNHRGEPFDKCRGHGGASLRGTAAPMFSSGRYSAFLPTRLVAKYDQMTSDTDLLDMRSRAELLEVRILDIVEHLDEKGSFELFRDLNEQWELYEKYMMLTRASGKERQKEYSARAADALNNVARLIKKGMDEGNLWGEIRTNIESIRKLADTEQRQMKSAETAVMVDRVMLFAAAMGAIFRDSIMSLEAIAMEQRRTIIANVESQVNSLLIMDDLKEAVDLEFELD